MSRGGLLSGIKLTKKHTREMFCHPHISDIARHILICGAKDVGSVIIYMSWYLARHPASPGTVLICQTKTINLARKHTFNCPNNSLHLFYVCRPS